MIYKYIKINLYLILLLLSKINCYKDVYNYLDEYDICNNYITVNTITYYPINYITNTITYSTIPTHFLENTITKTQYITTTINNIKTNTKTVKDINKISTKNINNYITLIKSVTKDNILTQTVTDKRTETLTKIKDKNIIYTTTITNDVPINTINNTPTTITITNNNTLTSKDEIYITKTKNIISSTTEILIETYNPKIKNCYNIFDIGNNLSGFLNDTNNIWTEDKCRENCQNDIKTKHSGLYIENINYINSLQYSNYLVECICYNNTLTLKSEKCLLINDIHYGFNDSIYQIN